MVPANTPESPNDFPQYEREAVIDLLHLCEYADNVISLREGSVVNQARMRMGWEGRFHDFEPESIERARDAASDPDRTRAYVDRTASRLRSPQARRLALEYCTRLLSSDGVASDGESTLLGQLRKALAG